MSLELTVVIVGVLIAFSYAGHATEQTGRQRLFRCVWDRSIVAPLAGDRIPEVPSSRPESRFVMLLGET